MLVLTQKEGESLQIGDNVTVHIKRVKGNWVRLAIDAPREVTLVRVPADPKASPPQERRRGADRRRGDDRRLVPQDDSPGEPSGE